MNPVIVKIQDVNAQAYGPLFPDLADKKIVEAILSHFAVLQCGTEGGRTSVALMAQLPNGEVAMIECTGRMFESMAGALFPPSPTL